MRATLLILAMALLTGCAASVKTGGAGQQLQIEQGNKESLAVTFKGTSKVKANPDWGRIRTEWMYALEAEASAAGLSIREQRAAPQVPQPGTLLLVEVSNFRHLTSGQRYGLGVMTGNAWINSRVSFIDQQSGALLGVRTYDTSSSAWEGVFSAMTDEQLQAISKEMIAEIVNARPIPKRQPALSSVPAPLSKEERIRALRDDPSLSYEEYMQKLRAINAE